MSLFGCHRFFSPDFGEQVHSIAMLAESKEALEASSCYPFIAGFPQEFYYLRQNCRTFGSTLRLPLSDSEVESAQEIRNVEMKAWHSYLRGVVMICFDTMMANIQHRCREMEGKTEPVGHLFGESNLGGPHWSVVPY